MTEPVESVPAPGTAPGTLLGDMPLEDLLLYLHARPRLRSLSPEPEESVRLLNRLVEHAVFVEVEARLNTSGPAAAAVYRAILARLQGSDLGVSEIPEGAQLW